MTDAVADGSTGSLRFSDYIVYVDESGDHGLVSPEYPVFVLAFCIFEKRAYADQVTSLMHQFKFKHFGHDAVVLHEREIRKALPPFSFLLNAARRSAFLHDLSALVERAPFALIAAVIRKEPLAALPGAPPNPYHLAMKFGLERVHHFLHRKRDIGRLHVVFESRGRREDDELELEFRRVLDDNATFFHLDMEPLFVSKQANHCGLQLADLIARPIGLHVLRPEQDNRAYSVLEAKFDRAPDGSPDGWGLKCYP